MAVSYSNKNAVKRTARCRLVKFIIVVGDGMADYPIQHLGGKTPLQVADHPNMDEIVSKGSYGTLKTVPDDMESNTDVAVLSVLGYNPRRHYPGRGPLEAASMGVKLSDDDIAFRFNLITEKDGVLEDFSAGHIETEEARELVKAIDEHLGSSEIRFYSGVDYRHLLVLRGRAYSDKVRPFAPHYAVGKRIDEIKATPLTERGTRTANLLNGLIAKSKEILSDHPVNLRRVRAGKKPANMIWPWSPGRKPNFPTLKDMYNLRGAVISAVDVVNGIGACTGMDIIRVPGATGYFDTNYEGKAKYAVESLEDHDLVFVHVEAPDEAGHMGDSELKIRAIEDLDKRLLGNIMNGIQQDYTIAILADHMTPVSVRNHTSDPVPFAVYFTKDEKKNRVRHFDEESVRNGKKIRRGYNFLPFFLRCGSR